MTLKIYIPTDFLRQAWIKCNKYLQYHKLIQREFLEKKNKYKIIN